MSYVYVLRSLKNGKRYVGFTEQDVRKRLWQHNGKTNRWTAQNDPFEIIYTEEVPDRTSAKRREQFLKSGHGRTILNQLIPR